MKDEVVALDGSDNTWSTLDVNTLRVRLLNKNEIVTLELSND